MNDDNSTECYEMTVSCMNICTCAMFRCCQVVVCSNWKGLTCDCDRGKPTECTCCFCHYKGAPKNSVHSPPPFDDISPSAPLKSVMV